MKHHWIDSFFQPINSHRSCSHCHFRTRCIMKVCIAVITFQHTSLLYNIEHKQIFFIQSLILELKCCTLQTSHHKQTNEHNTQRRKSLSYIQLSEAFSLTKSLATDTYLLQWIERREPCYFDSTNIQTAGKDRRPVRGRAPRRSRYNYYLCLLSQEVTPKS